MQLQYTANFRYGLRHHYRCVLRELECKKGIQWQEEEERTGCSSLKSVFTIECEEHQREEIEHKLLVRVPVYRLDEGYEWMQQQPYDFINIAAMIQALKPARIRAL